MRAGSVLVLAVLFALVVFALRRVRKRGTPCFCSGDGKSCGGHCPGCKKRKG